MNKTDEQLLQLQKEGLGIAYLGLESGDDSVLHMIVKGNTAVEMQQASLKIKSAGIQLSTMAMLGVGGRKYSAQHITETAKMLSATSPQYFSFLTTFSVPGTPYHRMLERGLIEPLTSFELLFEMKEILRLSTFKSNPVLFRANHVSNTLPIGGTLPKDKELILNQLELWLESTPKDQYPTSPRNM